MELARARPPCSKSKASPSRTPTATRRCSASTSPSERGERVALLGPNGAGKTTLVLHCNGVLTRRRRARAGRRPTGREARTSPRSGAASASCSRTPTTSSSCPRSATTSRSVPDNFGVPAAELDARVDSRARRGRDGRVRRPHTPSPQLRAAAPDRRRHRARVPTGAARPRRAVVEPRPRQPARARRHRLRARP